MFQTKWYIELFWYILFIGTSGKYKKRKNNNQKVIKFLLFLFFLSLRGLSTPSHSFATPAQVYGLYTSRQLKYT